MAVGGRQSWREVPSPSADPVPVDRAGRRPVFRAFPPRTGRRLLAFAGFALLVAAAWIFTSTYRGIEGDARIYVARAMADIDPAGLGRDMMFALDGQSGFSVYRFFAAALVAAFGPGGAALGIAVAASLVWGAGMAAFASRFASGRAFVLLFVCAMVLRCPYGFYPLMSAREVLAVPRPFSEAAVLFAFAALCEARIATAFALLALAAMVHPIMALPAFAVTLVVLTARDRRWAFAALLAGLAAVGAGLAGVPLFARLTQTIDASWRAVLEERNCYLFLGYWNLASLGPLCTQGATLIIAASFCEGRRRSLLLATLVVGLGGAAVSFLFGDLLSLLLVVQAQAWRSLWLVAVLAMPSLGLCIVHLPRRGAYGHLALAFLVLSWLTFDVIPFVPAAAAVAVVFHLLSRTRRPVLARFVLPAVWAVVAALAVCVDWPDAVFALREMRAAPPDMADTTLRALWHAGVLPALFIALAALGTRRLVARRPLASFAAALAVFVAALATPWDARSPAAREIGQGRHQADLVALLARTPGEVLWLSKDEEWYWVGRPQWSSFVQASGIVFSRPLAMQWRERAGLLVSLGLMDEAQLLFWRLPPTRDVRPVPEVSRTAVATLCARADAPAWIVAALPDGHEPPPGLGAVVWRAPVAQARRGVAHGEAAWTRFGAFSVIPCAGGTVSPPV